MADGDRCLSDLSDDLLRHILSFAPASDRAATAVLSRRWLRLWRTSGDVYLDSRSFDEEDRKAFVRGAERVLAAAEGHLRRLTFVVAGAGNRKVKPTTRLEFQKYASEAAWEAAELIGALVSIPAARRVEELQIEVKNNPNPAGYTLSFGSLPSEALRVLRVIRCSTLTTTTAAGGSASASAAAFPVLADLHLQDCSVSPADLQSIIDAAPRLSTLHLADVHFSAGSSHRFYDDDQLEVRRLLIPAVTALVLADCRYGSYGSFKARLELDVPRLQRFTYRGHVQDSNNRLSLTSTSSVIHVDLHLTYKSRGYNGGLTPTRNLFWQFIQNFNTTKLLKLKLDIFTMNELALEDKASRDELLGGLSFDLLEQLELEVECNYNYGPDAFEASMVMLANLLHCCPVVRDLRLRFNMQQTSWIDPSIEKQEAGLDFDKSVSGFRNRRRKSVVSIGGKSSDEIFQASYSIPGFTSGCHSFRCLQRHLKKVSLQFCMDEPNCLGVKLAKFFAENAMVLQEMQIDDGGQEMLEHVNPSVRRWMALTQIKRSRGKVARGTCEGLNCHISC